MLPGVLEVNFVRALVWVSLKCPKFEVCVCEWVTASWGLTPSDSLARCYQTLPPLLMPTVAILFVYMRVLWMPCATLRSRGSFTLPVCAWVCMGNGVYWFLWASLGVYGKGKLESVLTPIDLNVAWRFLHISTFVPNKDRNSSSSGLCRGLHELGREGGRW